MATKIPADFQPSQRVYELLKAYGVQNPIEFVGHELPAFMMYWEGIEGRKAAKSNWDSTCMNWMKRTYEDKRHQMAQNRVYGKSKPDVFQQVVGDLFAQDMAKQSKPKRKPLRIDSAPIPGAGETISQDDAFAQLRKSGVLK